MSLREDVETVLRDAGINVVSWGVIPAYNTRVCIVRPAGMADEREIVEVWIVNQAMSFLTDIDHGLGDFMLEVWQALRRTLVQIVITQANAYDPTGKQPRSTMVLTGTGTQRGLRAVA